MTSTTRRSRAFALRAFLAGEAVGGIVLLAAAALALIVANSSLAPAYRAVLERPLGPPLAPDGTLTVQRWIDDGLMAVFFLLVGLEIKRELIDGELASPKRRRLPLAAAAMGMICPALLYLALTRADPALAIGWAIPAATDIAFAIGVLALLGDRVPPSLKLLLTTVAIADDMGAIAIIAIFYNHGIGRAALIGAVGVTFAMIAINRRGVTRLTPYLVGFALLWLLLLQAGIHPTLAGVVTALLVPVKRARAARHDQASPLHRLERAINPLVAYGIVPLFGFANAGVTLTGVTTASFADPLVRAVILALFVGKQVGILAGVRISVALGWASLPRGVGWTQLYGVALLAGIGFTMSLFIGGLAFPAAASTHAVRLGVFGGSLISAIAGYAVLRFAAPRRPGRSARPGLGWPGHLP